MKTADEMFKELGYLRMPESDRNEIQYRNYDNNFDIVVYRSSEVIEFYVNGAPSGLTDYDEILACAQLIKEMKEANDKN